MFTKRPQTSYSKKMSPAISPQCAQAGGEHPLLRGAPGQPEAHRLLPQVSVRRRTSRPRQEKELQEGTGRSWRSWWWRGGLKRGGGSNQEVRYDAFCSVMLSINVWFDQQTVFGLFFLLRFRFIAHLWTFYKPGWFWVGSLGEKDILSPLVDHRKAKMAASNDEVKRHEPGSYYKSAETCRNGKVGLGSSPPSSHQCKYVGIMSHACVNLLRLLSKLVRMSYAVVLLALWNGFSRPGADFHFVSNSFTNIRFVHVSDRLSFSLKRFLNRHWPNPG